MNHIERIRADIKKAFNEEICQKGNVEVIISPSKQFRLVTTNYWPKELRLNFTKVEVYEQKIDDKLFDFIINDSRFFYGWVTTNGVDYLVCAEDIFGGQTIVDLTNRKMNSYSPGENGFIWTEFHLSPDGKTLATIGCYWACPYVMKLFDFSSPLSLPLKEIGEIELLDNDEIILGWLDNETLKMKGFKRIYDPEYFEEGSMRVKMISETDIEREIQIKGHNATNEK